MISGETLRLIRIMKGIKQETMAFSLGISQPAYCKIEKRICIEGKKLDRILDALHTTKEDLDYLTKVISLQKPIAKV